MRRTDRSGSNVRGLWVTVPSPGGVLAVTSLTVGGSCWAAGSAGVLGLVTGGVTSASWPTTRRTSWPASGDPAEPSGEGTGSVLTRAVKLSTGLAVCSATEITASSSSPGPGLARAAGRSTSRTTPPATGVRPGVGTSTTRVTTGNLKLLQSEPNRDKLLKTSGRENWLKIQTATK